MASKRCEPSTNNTPDLVLLDVQMPGLTGFEVARRLLRAGIEAHFVFVTAFDQHAIEAFEVNAVDYLLKPVESGTAGHGGRPRATPDSVLDRQAAKPPSTEEMERLLQLMSERQARREQLAAQGRRSIPAGPIG